MTVCNSETHVHQLQADSSPSPRCQGRSGRGTVDCSQYTDVVSYDPGCKATVEGLRKGLPWKHHIQNQIPSSWGIVDSTRLVRKALSSLKKKKYNYVTEKDTQPRNSDISDMTAIVFCCVLKIIYVELLDQCIVYWIYELFQKCKFVISTNSNCWRYDVTSVNYTEQISGIVLDLYFGGPWFKFGQGTSYPDGSFMVLLSPSRQISGFT